MLPSSHFDRCVEIIVHGKKPNNWWCWEKEIQSWIQRWSELISGLPKSCSLCITKHSHLYATVFTIAITINLIITIFQMVKKEELRIAKASQRPEEVFLNISFRESLAKLAQVVFSCSSSRACKFVTDIWVQSRNHILNAPVITCPPNQPSFHCTSRVIWIKFWAHPRLGKGEKWFYAACSNIHLTC